MTPLDFCAPLLMQPVFSARPWGGRLLEERLGKELPPGERIGESWELSDHPNGRSRVAGGRFAGMEFGELLRRYPREMIGRDTAPARYPLLIKIIDAAQDLSIQVHPDDARAMPHGDRGKTECWYVMDSKIGTEVIFGLRAGITPEMVRRGARDGSIERMVGRYPLNPGDFLFVDAGTVHAILGGTLLCEIQQSSDTTYRLWDWKRQPPRELHVEHSLEAINWSAPERRPCPVPRLGSVSPPMVLTDNQFFRVRALDIPAGKAVALPDDLAETGTVIVCAAGKARLEAREGEVELATGSTAYLTASCVRAVAEAAESGPARLLLADSREL